MNGSMETSDRKHLDAAAELCGIVGARDLFAWLALPRECDEAVALDTLRAKRKRMQGMQANPKYRDEALFLIKHFQAIQDAVTDKAVHLEDMRFRTMSSHLPSLELTIRGVLAAGDLVPEQEAFLRHSADELGVDSQTFEGLIERLCRETGVARAFAPPPLLLPVPGAQHLVNHYAVLGVPPGSAIEDIKVAHKEGMVRLKRHPDPTVRVVLASQMDFALRVLADPATRAAFDASPVVTASVTGAPARARVMAPDLSGRSRRATPAGDLLLSGDGLPARVELVGETVRQIRLVDGLREVVIALRNAGDQPMAGTVHSTAVWLVPHRKELDAHAKLQDIRFRVDADRANDEDRGTIVVDAGEAGRVEVRFEAFRPKSFRDYGRNAMFVLVPILLVGSMTAGLFAWQRFAPKPAPKVIEAPVALPWVIRIDPSAAEVRVNDVFAGRGPIVSVRGLPNGPARLTVLQPNFKPFDQTVDAEQGRSIDVVLQQIRRLDQQPAQGLVRTLVPAKEADPAIAHAADNMEACARERASPGSLATGTVNIYIGKDGVPFGLDVSGDQVGDASLKLCIERWAAGVSLPPLPSGDYATLRWDYAVTGRSR